MAIATRAIAAAAFLLAAAPLAAVEEGWNMPTPYDRSVFHTENDLRFAEGVRLATQGVVDIRVHPAETLFRHEEIAETVTRGLVPIGGFLLSRLATENAVFGVDSLPYLARNHDEARRLWQASRPAIVALLAERNLTLLYAVPWSGQSLFLGTEIADPADLVGIAVSTYNLATRRLAEMLGMSPIEVRPGDFAAAYADGRIRATIASSSTAVTSRLWTYNATMINLGAWLPKTAVVVNSEVLNAVAEDHRKAMLEAAALAEARGWEMSAAESDTRIATLKENGMTVTEPSGTLLDALTEAGRAMLAEWQEETGAVGADILEAYGR